MVRPERPVTGRLMCRCRFPLLLLFSALSAFSAVPAVSSGAPASARPLLEKALAGPLADCREIVFAMRARGRDGHWYANFAYWSDDPSKMMYGGSGGRLAKLDLTTGKVALLVNDPKGDVRDPTVDYDGRTILFSYRKGGTHHYNLYTVRPDGSDLTQRTFGPWDDIEAAYLPSGDLVFCSSRAKRWVGCWFTQVATLHRMKADGSDRRLVSSNPEHDNTPAVMPDGRLLYTRWEYVDRSQVDFHHLWTFNPDGTGQMTFFGNMNPGTVMIDAKPIPGTDKVLSIFSPGHGSNEHCGTPTIVDPNGGPDLRGMARPVRGAPGGSRDPYPLSETLLLLANRRQLLLVDGEEGRSEVLYESPDLEVHEPWPVRPRVRERIIPDRADWSKAAGRVLLVDAHHGRNLRGVKPGDIRRLLVVEVLPKPVNFSGGPDSLTWLGTFSLERALGTVPVEADGSAWFELPANRPVFFVALDANDAAVKRMQSFTSVMPGETTGCVGCHEGRTELAQAPAGPAALRRPPSRLEPFEGFPSVLDFPRDVQPLLDRHCLKCHDWPKRSGGVILSGDRGPRFSHSYWTLFARNQVADGANGYGNRPPRSIGAGSSPLMKKLDGSHHEVKVPERDRRTVWLWIETGATYAGTYAALSTGTVGVGVFPEDLQRAGPVSREAREALGRRCASCHSLPRGPNQPREGKGIPLPCSPSPRKRGGAPYERFVADNDPVARYSPNILFNLTRPAKSLILLAPLAKEAGGYGSCAPKGQPPVFADTSDPDYRRVLAPIERAAARLAEIKRFDMPGFRPNEHYVREMKRYGVLAPSFDLAKDPLDVYAVDEAYWRSLWHVPER